MLARFEKGKRHQVTLINQIKLDLLFPVITALDQAGNLLQVCVVFLYASIVTINIWVTIKDFRPFIAFFLTNYAKGVYEGLFLERFQLMVFKVIIQILRLLFQNWVLGEFSSLLGNIFRQVDSVSVSMLFSQERSIFLQEHVRLKPFLRNVVFAATAKVLRCLGIQLLLVKRLFYC